MNLPVFEQEVGQSKFEKYAAVCSILSKTIEEFVRTRNSCRKKMFFFNIVLVILLFLTQLLVVA